MPCRQNESNKGRAIRAIAEELGIDMERVAFVGNDVNDLPAMALVGIPIACDAEPMVLEVVRFVTPGAGAAARFAMCAIICSGRDSPLATAETTHPSGSSSPPHWSARCRTIFPDCT